jgi:hypothetical protein
LPRATQPVVATRAAQRTIVSRQPKAPFERQRAARGEKRAEALAEPSDLIASTRPLATRCRPFEAFIQQRGLIKAWFPVVGRASPRWCLSTRCHEETFFCRALRSSSDTFSGGAESFCTTPSHRNRRKNPQERDRCTGQALWNEKGSSYGSPAMTMSHRHSPPMSHSLQTSRQAGSIHSRVMDALQHRCGSPPGNNPGNSGLWKIIEPVLR